MAFMLSQWFSLEELTHSEIAVRKGIDNTPNAEQSAALKLTALQMDFVRTLLGRPVLVSSGFRSKKLNDAAGGVAKSAHMTGYAVDFTAPSFGSTRAIFDKIKASSLLFDKLILEYPDSHNGGWVHISFAPEMRRQCYTYSGGAYRAA